MPAAVVNHLHFREAPSPELFARAQDEVVPQARRIEGFRSLHIVQVAPDHFILIVMGETTEVLDKVATEVGSPWMMAHVVPLLVSAPERHVGPLVATTDRQGAEPDLYLRSGGLGEPVPIRPGGVTPTPGSGWA